MNSKPYLTFALIIAVILGGIYYFPRASAVTIIETFPNGSSFTNDFGTEIPTGLDTVAFLNIIDSNNDDIDDILAIDSSGKGEIILKEGSRYRSYGGLEFSQIPQAQIIEDFTGDQMPDIVTLIPSEKEQSKEWHYAKIIQINSDSFTVDTPLRKNILGSSTIIAPNGKQYSVEKNNGPDDESPANAIYLDKEIGNTAELPAYNSFLQTNQYIAYLLPSKVPVGNNQIIVHTNQGGNSFLQPECTVYMPRTTDSITALASGDFNSDNKKDLVAITHTKTKLQTNRVQATYDADRKILTFNLGVIPNDFTAQDLRGSYFSFTKYEDQTFTITANTSNQITVAIQIPPSGASLEELKTSIASGDSFWLTLNDDMNRKELVFTGNNDGCFTYTGEVKGIIYDSNFGKVTLPGAQTLTDSDRTVITDTTVSLLPVDSFKDRQLKVGEDTFTIEHNDQGHVYLSPEYGDTTGQMVGVAKGIVANTYAITALSPALRVNLDAADQIVSVFRQIPNDIASQIDAKPLATENPWPRPIDDDGDEDIDLIFIHQNRIFLKLNNERSR